MCIYICDIIIIYIYKVCAPPNDEIGPKWPSCWAQWYPSSDILRLLLVAVPIAVPDWAKPIRLPWLPQRRSMWSSTSTWMDASNYQRWQVKRMNHWKSILSHFRNWMHDLHHLLNLRTPWAPYDPSKGALASFICTGVRCWAAVSR